MSYFCKYLLLGSLFLLVPCSLGADCNTFFQTAPAAVLAKAAQNRRLPEEAQIALENHTGMRQLAKEWKSGQNLYFGIHYLKLNGAVRTGNVGESIQARFVYEILRATFPKAEFEETLPYLATSEILKRPKLEGKKAFVVSIHDSAEKMGGFNESMLKGTGHHLEMALLKATNPSISELTAKNAKKILGLSPDTDKVIQLYDRSGQHKFKDGIHGQKSFYAQTWAALRKDTQANVLITSHLMAMDFPPEFMTQFAATFRMSKLTSTDLLHETRRPILIVNDTVGIMPEVYKATDIALVSGEVNFFESLNAGVPTVSFGHGTNLLPYQKEALTFLTETASRTQIFSRIDSETTPEAIAAAAKVVLNARDRAVLPFKTEKSGATLFNQFLDALVTYLRAQE